MAVCDGDGLTTVEAPVGPAAEGDTLGGPTVGERPVGCEMVRAKVREVSHAVGSKTALVAGDHEAAAQVVGDGHGNLGPIDATRVEGAAGRPSRRDRTLGENSNEPGGGIASVRDQDAALAIGRNRQRQW